MVVDKVNNVNNITKASVDKPCIVKFTGSETNITKLKNYIDGIDGVIIGELGDNSLDGYAYSVKPFNITTLNTDRSIEPNSLKKCVYNGITIFSITDAASWGEFYSLQLYPGDIVDIEFF